MVYADTRYQLQETLRFPLPGKNVTELQSQFLITNNLLEQVTIQQLADWHRLSYDYVRKQMSSLIPQEDQTDSFLVTLSAKTRNFQTGGSLPFVFANGELGRRYLKRNSIKIVSTQKVSKLFAKPHTLACNEFLIKGRLLTERAPWLALAKFNHESELKASPMYIPVTPRETIGIAPDLWMDFHLFPRRRYCFCVEINLTPVTEKVWREKIRGYIHCVPVYKEKFGTDVIQVPVIIGTRDHFPKRIYPNFSRQTLSIRRLQALERTARLKQLIAWTQKELKEQNAKHMSDMFLFTDVALDTITPQELFLYPYWLIPNSPAPVPLISRKEEYPHV